VAVEKQGFFNETPNIKEMVVFSKRKKPFISFEGAPWLRGQGYYGNRVEIDSQESWPKGHFLKVSQERNL